MLRLSHLLSSDSPVYGDYTRIEIQKTNEIQKGDSSNNSSISLTSHSGTHLDAPYHFDEKGKKLDEFPTDFWFCNKPYLIERRATPSEILSMGSWGAEFESIPEETDILLIKTGFEERRQPDDEQNRADYIFNGPGLAPDLGLWLRKNTELKFIGFDFISLTSFQNRELGRIAHRAFLSSRPDGFSSDIPEPPILIIEDMKLSELNGSPKRVIISPLLFTDADGAPVTVFAETKPAVKPR
jgi:arylformamidase